MPGSAPPSDRYADAVRARRAELRRGRAQLLRGHRAELRSSLAVGRLAASAELSAALTGLGRELRHHADHAGRAGRAELPERVSTAVGRLAEGAAGRWTATLLPAARRVAAERGVADAVPWPAAGPLAAVLLRPPSIPLPAVEPAPGAVRALVAGATGGTWRLALLPAAALPAVGLPALGGWAAVPSAVVAGLALLVAAARAHRVAADRTRLRRWGAEVVSAVAVALERELAYRLIEVERVATVELDEAVARRRQEIDAELRALASEPEGADRART